MQTIPARQEGEDVWVPDIKFQTTIVETSLPLIYAATESGRTICRNERAPPHLLSGQNQQHRDNGSYRAPRVRIQDTQILIVTPPVRAPAQPVRAPGQTVTRVRRIIVESRRPNL